MHKLGQVLLAATVVGGGIGSAHAAGPGFDAFGNYITSSNSDPSVPANLFFDISTTGTFLVQGDDVAAQNVSLGGLVFPFYGNNYTSLTFTTNGYISTDPTDIGSDLSNDFPLPSSLSTGGGARIYPYHDDTEATIYGQYFDQSSSPLGTETYIAQWDACHFPCEPSFPADINLRYNVMLLRDGTIVFAYDQVSPEAGGGATVGIQNFPPTDGVAYLGNEAVMTDGMTILVLSPTSGPFPPTPLAGLADDVTIVGAELGVMQVRAQADITTDAVKAAFAAGSDDNVQTASTGAFGATRQGGLSAWLGGTAVGANGSFGPDMSGRSLAFHTGVDYLMTPWAVGGVSLGYGDARLSVGMLSARQTAFMVEPYLGLLLGDAVLVKGSFNYSRTSYDVTMPLGTFDATGHRYAGSLSVSAPFALPVGGLTLVPEISVTAGREKISNLTNGGGLSIPVDSVRFVNAEATAKLEKTFVTGSGTGKFYGLAGIDHVRTNGDNAVALFSTNYRDNRTGGVAGAGLTFQSAGGMSIDAHVVGRGLGTQARSLEARARIGIAF